MKNFIKELSHLSEFFADFLLFLSIIAFILSLIFNEKLKIFFINDPSQIHFVKHYPLLGLIISFVLCVFMVFIRKSEDGSPSFVILSFLPLFLTLMATINIDNNIYKTISLDSGKKNLEFKFYTKVINEEPLHMVDVKTITLLNKNIKDVDGKITPSSLTIKDEKYYTVLCQKNSKAITLTDCYKAIMQNQEKNY